MSSRVTLALSLLTAPVLAAAACAALLAPVPAAARTYGGAERDVPLARFQDPVCPGIVGVAQRQAEDMVGLIRDSAAKLGLRLADPATCRPNLLVVVIDDPRGYLAGLRQRKAYLFETLGNAELQALFDTPGPAHTWTRISLNSRDGLPIRPSQSLTEVPHTQMVGGHSLISMPVRRDIDSAMVLIDKRAVKGLSVAQVAAYATMRGLSGDQGERRAAAGETILGLFDAGANPEPAGLTPSDTIFLQTLYSTTPNVPAAATLALADARIAARE